MVDVYLELLDLGYFELKFAFDDLSDANVWKRPAHGLLSIGEIAGHIAYWQAVKFAGEGTLDYKPDINKCQVKSALIDRRFAYYTSNLNISPSDEQLLMTSAQVWGELLRIHNESIAYFKTLNVDLDSLPPGWPVGNTYREFLKYAIFHVSYHCGQMYSVRHILGETPPDN